MIWKRYTGDAYHLPMYSLSNILIIPGFQLIHQNHRHVLDDNVLHMLSNSYKFVLLNPNSKHQKQLENLLNPQRIAHFVVTQYGALSSRMLMDLHNTMRHTAKNPPTNMPSWNQDCPTLSSIHNTCYPIKPFKIK